MTAIFALLVGINDYPSYPLHGAVKDVENMRDYLVRERQVPEVNIKLLKNKEATRLAILNAFHTHLVNNVAIKKGDPILFYYAGHGTSKPAPAEWLGPPMNAASMVEAIVPYDSVGAAFEDGPKANAPIPDCKLNALLRQLAESKGNNITVVFDSCHSGHGTRNGAVPRGIEPQYVGELHEEMDDALLDVVDAGGSATQDDGRRGLTLRRDDTHVLLSACRRNQTAGDGSDGGFFSIELLKILREHGDGYTNEQIIDQVNKRFDKRWPGHRQEPSCEGFHRDRPMFHSAKFQRGSFSVLKGPDDNHCKILVGAAGGVTVGTLFQLYVGNNQRGSVSVDGVLPGTCTAELPKGVTVPAGMRALLAGLAKPTKIFIKDTTPQAAPVCDRLRARLDPPSTPNLDEAIWYLPVGTAEEADLVLEVDDGGVVAKRRGSQGGPLDISSPKIKKEHIEGVFPGVMEDFAIFDLHLWMENPGHPVTNDVQRHLYKLKAAQASEHEYDDAAYMAEVDDSRDFFGPNDAIITYEAGARYALLLRNNTKTHLYPYVLVFDPTLYEVEIFYKPSERYAPLRAGKALQLGGSSECENAILFTLPEGQTADISYFKIIFTDEPLSLAFMEQRAAMGYSGDKHNFMLRKTGKGAPPKKMNKGIWDSAQYRVRVQQA